MFPPEYDFAHNLLKQALSSKDESTLKHAIESMSGLKFKLTSKYFLPKYSNMIFTLIDKICSGHGGWKGELLDSDEEIDLVYHILDKKGAIISLWFHPKESDIVDHIAFAAKAADSLFKKEPFDLYMKKSMVSREGLKAQKSPADNPWTTPLPVSIEVLSSLPENDPILLKSQRSLTFWRAKKRWDE